MTSRTRPALALVALLASTGSIAACAGSDDAGSDDSIGAEAPAAEPAEEPAEESGGAEQEADEVRDIITNIRESFDNVVEATSDDGVLVAAGLSCPEGGDPFMLIGARGLTGDADYVAEVVPPLSYELRSVAQPDGTFRMQSDADPAVSAYTITLPTIGSGVTLEVPGCAS
ncbi:hypothetical protein [Ilumatobacter coccineus]|uniref:Lipoprotein n=1 Tax=Ilumatobacter coccineus (strain NBRC 103263 / KCTC 29153 / YM16-304) TaxID=1313172 RepID=A0A6C7E4Y7_ILUCY|nr:hypothetical protein [Ilumatobacter coccineus]BAN01651.1 hypothetical protein YM304_13370 [Ilumatobacter coccineus YM16-304]